MLPLNSNAKLRKVESKTKKLISFFAETEQFRDLLTAKLQKKPDIQIVSTLFFYPFPLFPPQTAYHLCHLQASGEAPIIETSV